MFKELKVEYKMWRSFGHSKFVSFINTLLHPELPTKKKKMKYNFYPVIHVKDHKHAIENCETAYKAKADGVFLINMGDTTQHELIKAYEWCRDIYSKILNESRY